LMRTLWRRVRSFARRVQYLVVGGSCAGQVRCGVEVQSLIFDSADEGPYDQEQNGRAVGGFWYYPGGCANSGHCSSLRRCRDIWWMTTSRGVVGCFSSRRSRSSQHLCRGFVPSINGMQEKRCENKWTDVLYLQVYYMSDGGMFLHLKEKSGALGSTPSARGGFLRNRTVLDPRTCVLLSNTEADTGYHAALDSSSLGTYSPGLTAHLSGHCQRFGRTVLQMITVHDGSGVPLTHGSHSIFVQWLHFQHLASSTHSPIGIANPQRLGAF